MSTPVSDDEWDLTVDRQRADFLALKQRIAGFLVTAAAVIIGFVAVYASARPLTMLELGLVAGSAGAGVLASGCALLALQREHGAQARHIAYRNRHQRLEDLPVPEQCAIDRHTTWGARLRASAFLCLFLQIVIAAAFLLTHLFRAGGGR